MAIEVTMLGVGLAKNALGDIERVEALRCHRRANQSAAMLRHEVKWPAVHLLSRWSDRLRFRPA
jgi:hypothetical protein